MGYSVVVEALETYDVIWFFITQARLDTESFTLGEEQDAAISNVSSVHSVSFLVYFEYHETLRFHPPRPTAVALGVPLNQKSFTGRFKFN